MSDHDTDEFDAAWQQMLARQRDMLDVVAAVVRLTAGGAHPVKVARLAAAVGRPVDQVRQLVDQADAGLPSLSTGHTSDEVWLDFATSGTPRFRYEIGDRRIGVGGCGPDIFEVAQALEQPMRVDTSCPITGTAISVELTPDGVGAVHPSDAVVAVLDLNTVAETAQLTDAARVDAEVCTQQTFFANPDVAQGWLDRHPGGRVIPVAAFDQWWRHLRTNTGGAPGPRLGTNTAPPSAGHH
ncbi:MAG: organomercurial lyase [Acidimicrobiales bacterium]